jgi:rhodanese-related sulfurtransferase
MMTVDVHQLKRMQMLHVQFVLFDLRAAEKFKAGHIRNAFHGLKSQFLEQLKSQVPLKETPVVIYSDAVDDLTEVADAAEKAGFINLVVLEGGFEGY